jgi:hypothetical protein
MQIGDLVVNKVFKTVGVIVWIKSFQDIDDTIAVLYSSGEQWEWSGNLEVICK